jgi:hypothetical protein
MAEVKVHEKTETYKPGQKVPHSGVYRVEHDSGHRISHEVTAISGRRFRPAGGVRAMWNSLWYTRRNTLRTTRTFAARNDEEGHSHGSETE